MPGLGRAGQTTIAVASGKGGTGKTTISVSLSLALSSKGPVTLLDCDVEEPNAGLFLRSKEPEGRTLDEAVIVPVPVVDEARCTACGACVRSCRFNAIILLKSTVMVFDDLCHGCGACLLACPSAAITEGEKEVGRLKEWHNGTFRFIQAEMAVGNAMAPPLIRAVKRRASWAASGSGSGVTIVDCPPGTSCPMVTALRGSDVVLLVTEPTPFGLHDLKLAVSTVRGTGIPFGVVINRSEGGDPLVEEFCEDAGISILARVPNDRRVAQAYSVGATLLDIRDAYSSLSVYGPLLDDLASSAPSLVRKNP